jgi:hypothetical protein
MQPVADRSSFNYAIFTFDIDEAGAVNVPIGVALWSAQRRWIGLRLAGKDERLARFNSREHYPYVALVREKIQGWIDSLNLPYHAYPAAPFHTEWWAHARKLLIHRIRMSEPRPIDCAEPEQELGPLYEAIMSPFRALREQRTRINGEIRQCLNGLEEKLKPKQELDGYGGRRVKVLRAFTGPSGTVVIEGVNLASPRAEQQSDAVVGRLLRVREGERNKLELLVGYLPSPEGLNGEKVLVDWIEHETGATAFDLRKQRQELHARARDLVAEAANPSFPGSALPY